MAHCLVVLAFTSIVGRLDLAMQCAFHAAKFVQEQSVYEGSSRLQNAQQT